MDKKSEILREYEEETRRLCDPMTVADPTLYRECMKKVAAMRPLAEAYTALDALKTRKAQAQEIISDPAADAELRLLAQQEIAEADDEARRLTEEIRVLSLPRDPDEDRNVILEIRAGAGGEEAALFAAALRRMYTMYADRRGLSWEVLNLNATELGGVKEIGMLITGDGAYSRFRFESGVHRVQRVPETETGGRIHTSTATVAVMPEAQEVELEIDPKDLQIDTYRSSGAGGQHINKTESAIRITHLSTGTVVECQDERSQYKNKDKAMRVLRSRLLERKKQEQQASEAADRRSQVGTGDRSERIRTYNFPQGRVTDHRIGLTLYKIDSIMNGDLDELIDALAAESRQAKASENE